MVQQCTTKSCLIGFVVITVEVGSIVNGVVVAIGLVIFKFICSTLSMSMWGVYIWLALPLDDVFEF